MKYKAMSGRGVLMRNITIDTDKQIIDQLKSQLEREQKCVELAQETMNLVLSSMIWYNDTFKGPDHEFNHAWMVEWPSYLEDTITKIKSLREQK